MNPASIGIANSTTDWLTLAAVTFCPPTSSVIFNNFIATRVDSGQIYRWIPRCTGTTPAGTVDALDTLACSVFSGPMFLRGGASPGLFGISYQWRRSADGTSWTSIQGATDLFRIVAGTASEYFNCTTTCRFNAHSNVTPPVYIRINGPGAISGPDSLCAGATVILSDDSLGGTWFSDNNNVATINAAGLVTGIAAGITTITYFHYPCAVIKTIYVNPAPHA
jgi:Bacterial Ig-like domain (group 2)